MGSSLLFRWEEYASLKHHCGECHRPLAHPRARTSCFGKHVEPCAHYHQILFMSSRGHNCDYCSRIHSADKNRHKAIAKQLRIVYESCGEIDWAVIPLDSDSTVTETASDSNNGSSPGIQNGRTDASSNKIPRREKKDAKNLARAVSRTREITQEEVGYVDSVIHSADATGHDPYEPRNTEEIRHIEEQLRYHAQLYITQGSQVNLKRVAEAPREILKVDFEAEMDRILTAFRITELLKRNAKAKGMQGKELKKLLERVDILKQSIIEDIILVTTDKAEVLMRRTSYLRYVNKRSYEIVEDSYSTVDRRKGERLKKRVKDSDGTETEIEAENKEEGSDSFT